MPKVSVVVPAYNAEPYLEECLTSILAQSFSDRELIVVDDGSTDRTPEIAQAFAAQIRYHRQANQGVAAALNTGIELARGEYISLVAADDGLCSGATNVQAALLNRYPQVGMVHGGAQFVDKRGQALRFQGSRGGETFSHLPSRRAVRHLLKGNTVICSSVMIRKTCFEQLGGFRQEHVPGEDWEMWLRIAAHHDLICIGRPLARRRIHDASLTAGFTVQSMEASHSKILRSLFSETRLAGHHDLETYAYASNDRTLAGLAASLRQRATFFRYMGLALRRRPSLLLESGTWDTLLGGWMMLMPQPVFHAARRLKSSVRPGPIEKAGAAPD